MKFIRVGILRGGLSHKAESLEYGNFLIKSLKNAGHMPVDIFVDENGYWYVMGKLVQPASILSMVDVLWNALYDKPKDMKFSINVFSRNVGLPLISETDLAFGILSKPNTVSDFLKNHQIKTVPSILFRHEKELEQDRVQDFVNFVVQKTSPSWLIRTFDTPENLNIIAKNQKDLITASHLFIEIQDEIVVSTVPIGKRGHIGIISNFRGHSQYPLIPFENKNEHGLHNTFTKNEKLEIIEFAKKIHKVLDTPHVLGIDFVLSPYRGLVLEHVHTRPIHHCNSNFCQSLNSLGIEQDEVISQIVTNILKK